ncbi:hypothetical protein GCM10029964_083870 [Kibdelosporangium lantanae]
MAVAWNTDTGRVALTVTRSTLKGGWQTVTNGRVSIRYHKDDQMWPAHPIEPGGDNDLTLVRQPVGGYLAADYRVLNGRFPLFHVGGRVEVKFDSQVGTRTYIGGDDYPDFEINQYYQHDRPRSLGRDEMSELREVATFPLMSHRNVYWTNGQQQ